MDSFPLTEKAREAPKANKGVGSSYLWQLSLKYQREGQCGVWELSGKDDGNPKVVFPLLFKVKLRLSVKEETLFRNFFF